MQIVILVPGQGGQFQLFPQTDGGNRDFLGGPVVKSLPSNAWDEGSIPVQGTKIPRSSQWNQVNEWMKRIITWQVMEELEGREGKDTVLDCV